MTGSQALGALIGNAIVSAVGIVLVLYLGGPTWAAAATGYIVWTCSRAARR